MGIDAGAGGTGQQPVPHSDQHGDQHGDEHGTAAGPDLAALGLADLDPEALIRSSSFCAMVHAGQALGHEIAPELAALGLTPTLYLVLGQVLCAPDSTPATLARRCAMSPQALAATLSGAEQRGLVRRNGERGRGRATRVRLTTAGVELLLAGWPVVHGAGGQRLTATQHQALQSLLEQVRGGHDPGDVVVLCDEHGNPLGTHPRATVHTTDTPLHLAFSTHLRRADGRVLLTRRALHKKTWPGVWTNSACGHLAPGEDARQAAVRRVPGELGAAPQRLREVLPGFRYRAVDASGIVEHELCPVLVGWLDVDDITPDPDEVAEHAWVEWDQLRRAARETPMLLSPWCVLQVEQMGDDPWQ